MSEDKFKYTSLSQPEEIEIFGKKFTFNFSLCIDDRMILTNIELFGKRAFDLYEKHKIMIEDNDHKLWEHIRKEVNK